jgi:fused signal recognition particle receptor
MEPIYYLVIAVVVAMAIALIWWLGRGSRAPSAPTRPRDAKTGLPFASALRNVWATGLDDETWSDLEEVLLAADVGVDATNAIVSSVRRSGVTDAAGAREAVAVEIRNQFRSDDRALDLSGRPAVVLVVGVNGTGKTTTIAKLTRWLQNQGQTVVLGAADTFRAAATEQLVTWGDRLGVRVVRGSEGGDPASVAFDTVSSGKAKHVDVVIIDTAGRLHGKKNLMAELTKIHRVAAGDRGEVDEVLLVLDATAGQNGLAQVREFTSAVPLTGIVLTKLDGTARGGIVVAVEKGLGVPVKFVGLGESLDDLEPFDPDRFVSELMETA